MFLFPCTIHTTGLIFETGQFSFQALRTIGYAVNGGADIGECLSTCSRIVDGDTESWYLEWNATAERVEAKADSFLAQDHTVSAKECYFRASAYYRTAEFFLHTDPDDQRIVETWRRSRDTFLSAAALSDRPILPVEIPFEGGSLPAYLCLVDDSGEPRPLIVAHSGFDGTKEELYFSIGLSAVERGYNCLLFEGPGQGEVIRLQHIPSRPDWESVVSPVIDYALELPFVDTERIVLIGYSMGGYFAPRAVTRENRIAACVANGGLYSVYESILCNNPPGLDSILDDEQASLEYDS
ncbi:alpha/beta hydrolase, partial [Candidatus Fermentibacteria bacterium]